jgi:beta-fructofuranosidase
MDLRHRPQYHFLPLANWMNDPNGLIQWKGVYHLFYQYHPNSANWGPMHWGHATSRDLVHWVHQPIALAPTPGGPDKDGVWSGCAVNRDGVPTLVYTGVRPEVQCLASSDDEMIVWRKSPCNPVIAGPPEGLEVTGFRDPCVWREGDGWYMALGSGIRGRGGAILLYRSPDLERWEYLGLLCEGKIEETGHNWECPNFLPLGDRHLLLFSPEPFRQAHYFTGRYADHRFTPQQHGLLDHGGLYYAPQAFIDESGRRICLGWLLEGRNQEATLAAGWAGVQSLPRELSLAADGSLRQRPVPELASLRREHVRVQPGAIEGLMPLAPVRGACLELSAELDPQQAQTVGLAVRRSPDGAEGVTISYEAARQQLVVDSRAASLAPETEGRLAEAPLDLQGEPLSLRVFLDESVIEVFANERACLTARVYPTREDSIQVALVASGGSARLLALDAWRMDGIWKSSGC